jgi:hypothetical protein
MSVNGDRFRQLRIGTEFFNIFPPEFLGSRGRLYHRDLRPRDRRIRTPSSARDWASKTYQNSKRIPSWTVLGLPPLSTWPNCGVPMVTLEPVPRLSIGWLKILKNSARNWIL